MSLCDRTPQALHVNVTNRLLLGSFKLIAASFEESLEEEKFPDSGCVSELSSTTQEIIGTRNKCSDALLLP